MTTRERSIIDAMVEDQLTLMNAFLEGHLTVDEGVEILEERGFDRFTAEFMITGWAVCSCVNSFNPS